MSNKITCAKCGKAFSAKQKRCAACEAEKESAQLAVELKAHKEKRLAAKQQEKKAAVKRRRVAKKKATKAQLKKINETAKAKQELAERELARRHLLPFVKRFKDDYQVGWVHKVFAKELERFYEDVVAGKQPRLMIFVPPRHGKSELVSNNFPSWVLGKQPNWEIIMASHTIGLPIRFSKANRARIDSKSYAAVFPETKLDRTSTSAEEWLTTQRGGLKCGGVGSGISGFGANVFIIDDPIKDAADAKSEAVRQNVKEWYSTVAETRLAPQGGMIIVQTRWHDDDLSGWQLRQDKDNREEGIPEEHLQNWRVVSFPAIAESDEYIDPISLDFFDEPDRGRIKVRSTGQALHPERYSLNYLKRKKVNMTDNEFSAVFQQNPVPASGEFFREEDFVYYNEPPRFHQYPILFAWDTAIGLKRANDYTVGVAGLVIPKGMLNHIYILDMFRNRVRDRAQVEAIVNMYLQYQKNAASLGVEQGQIWMSIEERVRAEFALHGLSPVVDETLVPVTDKRVRATPLQGWMNNHRVWFPKHQPWTQKIKDELLRFDSGVHDDIVDALAWLIRMAAKMPLVTKFQPEMGFKGRSVQQQLDDYYAKQHSGTSNLGYLAE